MVVIKRTTNIIKWSIIYFFLFKKKDCSYKHATTQSDNTFVEIFNTLDMACDNRLLHVFTQTDDSKDNKVNQLMKVDIKIDLKDSSTQTEDQSKEYCESNVNKKGNDFEEKGKGWSTSKENGENEKSIADQVKEVAQSALRETGMVYVESARMYYDYKTGYYYNSVSNEFLHC